MWGTLLLCLLAGVCCVYSTDSNNNPNIPDMNAFLKLMENWKVNNSEAFNFTNPDDKKFQNLSAQFATIFGTAMNNLSKALNDIDPEILKTLNLTTNTTKPDNKPSAANDLPGLYYIFLLLSLFNLLIV